VKQRACRSDVARRAFAALLALAISGCFQSSYDVQCEPNGGAIDVTWTPDAAFDRWRIYRVVAGGELQPHAEAEGAAWSDAAVEPGVEYHYVVRPIGADGGDVEGVGSCSATAGEGANGPAVASAPVCRAKNAKVDLAWSTVPDAIGYRVLRSEADGAFTSLGETVDPVWSDLSAANGVAYRYALVTLGAGGSEAAPSAACDATPRDPAVGDPEAPPAVADLRCRVKASKANLTWAAADGATRYRVERTTGAGPFLSIGETTETTFADFGLYLGNAYDYRVVALGPTGLASAPSDACGVTPGSRGGVAENRAPLIISTPVLSGRVGVEYVYPAAASDPDVADVLRFALRSGPEGLTIDPATGAIRWTPAAIGAFAVEIEVVDGRGGSDRQSFTIGVSERGVANALPIADPGVDRVVDLEPGAESAVVRLDASGSRDTDGYVAAYAWTGAIDPDDVTSPSIELPLGEHAFVLTVVDNAGATSAPANVIVQVRRQPRPPTLSVTPAVATLAAGETLVLDVQGSDPDGTVVTLAAYPALRNASFASSPAVQAEGAFRFTPDFDQAGTYLVRFKARDATGLWASQTAEITVTPGNRAPVLGVPAAAEVEAGRELVLGITASDPDLDPVVVTASDVPANALFLPGTRSLTFQPASDQVGTYTVAFVASDGRVSTAPQSVVITVVPPSDGATPLVLEVDPPASPNFAASARITGRVNLAPGGESPIATTPLITGVSPANGVQGATLDVVLTGESTGPRAPNFVAGASTAAFGDGVTVESLTVDSPSRAVARVRIDPTAALGPRQITVTAGDETIESVLAFDVALGRARIEGRLVDEATGQPIAGAVVAIEGSAARTTTGLDGSFSFDEVPPGTSQLLILPPNHAPIRREITALAGQSLALEGIESAATVFDPTAPASATLLSVLGRGATSASPTLGREALKEMIVDTLLVVGGNEAGALDEYDNQISTLVQGDGFVSVSDFGTGYVADQFQRGESFALTDILLTLGLGLAWEGGPPLTITEWIDALQEQVDAAWANPAAPDSKYAIVLFNRGPRLSPEPPRLSTSTRLNPLQAHLLSTSLLTYAFTADDDTFNSPSRFWRNFYAGRNARIEGQLARAQINGANLFFSGSAGILLGALEISAGRLGAGFARVAGIGFGGVTIAQQFAAAGVLYGELRRIIGFSAQDRAIPAPPILESAVLEYQPDETERVVVRFERSQSEPPSLTPFVYTLYRFDPNDDAARTIVDSRPGSQISLAFPELVDAAPPRGTWFYSITATRMQSAEDVIPTGELEQLRPFWTDPLLAGAEPVNTLGSVQRYTSDYSNAGSVIVAPPALLADVPEIDERVRGTRAPRARGRCRGRGLHGQRRVRRLVRRAALRVLPAERRAELRWNDPVLQPRPPVRAARTGRIDDDRARHRGAVPLARGPLRLRPAREPHRARSGAGDELGSVSAQRQALRGHPERPERPHARLGAGTERRTPRALRDLWRTARDVRPIVRPEHLSRRAARRAQRCESRSARGAAADSDVTRRCRLGARAHAGASQRDGPRRLFDSCRGRIGSFSCLPRDARAVGRDDGCGWRRVGGSRGRVHARRASVGPVDRGRGRSRRRGRAARVRDPGRRWRRGDHAALSRRDAGRTHRRRRLVQLFDPAFHPGRRHASRVDEQRARRRARVRRIRSVHLRQPAEARSRLDHAIRPFRTVAAQRRRVRAAPVDLGRASHLGLLAEGRGLHARLGARRMDRATPYRVYLAPVVDPESRRRARLQHPARQVPTHRIPVLPGRRRVPAA
jgi:fibronectin type 3 domain-containing protein